jgi:NAD(P)-dependent dehydrogenase (short-subunit alcohol dehydrogenase family)
MFDNSTFKGKVALITGGGTGLGKATAHRLSELGAQVCIASRKLEVLQSSANEISSETGNAVLPLQLDVRKYQQVEQVVTDCVNRFGQVDILLNNAAGNFIAPTESLSHKAFDVIVDIVLRGSYNCSLALGKYWIGAELPGDILNIITTYAFSGSGYVVPSSVAKAGVLNLTRSLAAEWGGRNIRVNAIAPGPVPTKGAWERLVPDPKLEQGMLQRIPMGRVGTHAELTSLAVFLLSDECRFINGEAVIMDGGEWLYGAGEFNFLGTLTDEDWSDLAAKIKR